MKLLTKTTALYLAFSLLVFIAGGLVFYQIIKSIVYSKVNESLITEKRIIEQQILHAGYIPDFTLYFEHQIEVILYNYPKMEWNTRYEAITDTMMFDSTENRIVPHRHLVVKNNTRNNRSYSINIFISTIDYQQVVVDIFFALLIMFISLLLVLVSVNYWISKKVWVPFYNTISRLSLYDIQKNQPLELPQANVREFRKLNTVLTQMSQKIQKDFINLKEFTEHVSHETQTPLAIIKSKLELLIQTENLGKEQMQLIQSVYESAAKLSRLNNSLSLISKIDNYQFEKIEDVDLNLITEKNLQTFQALINHKEIEIIMEVNENKCLQMNPDLADILISNLIINAIIHNIQKGKIFINIGSDNLLIKNTGNDPACDPEIFFDRFKKARGSDSPGLGLSIVNKISDLYHFHVKYSYTEGYHVLCLDF